MRSWRAAPRLRPSAGPERSASRWGNPADPKAGYTREDRGSPADATAPSTSAADSRRGRRSLLLRRRWPRFRRAPPGVRARGVRAGLRGTGRPAPPGDDDPDDAAGPSPAVPPDGHQAADGQLAVELDRVVPPSGNLWLAGQQIWLRPAMTGRAVRLWAGLDRVHVLLDGYRVKTRCGKRPGSAGAAAGAAGPAGGPDAVAVVVPDRCRHHVCTGLRGPLRPAVPGG